MPEAAQPQDEGLRRITVSMKDRNGNLKPIGIWVSIEDDDIFDGLEEGDFLEN